MRNDKSLIPILATTLGIGTLAAMDALMKVLALDIGAYNAILWRTALALPLAAAVFLWQRLPWPSPERLRIHAWRGLIISAMIFLFFWGLKYVPLAEAVALTFIAPLIALYLAAVLLGEKIGKRVALASLIGFSGALLIVAGHFDGDLQRDTLPGIGAILLSALLYAYNLILQRRQALMAGPVEIMTFQNGAVLLVYCCLAPWLAEVPSLTTLPQLTGAAILSLTGLILISWAYRRAEAKTLVPVEYTAFAWAGILGWVFLGEHVTIATVAGTSLIVIGCLMAVGSSKKAVEHTETTSL